MLRFTGGSSGNREDAKMDLSKPVNQPVLTTESNVPSTVQFVPSKSTHPSWNTATPDVPGGGTVSRPEGGMTIMPDSTDFRDGDAIVPESLQNASGWAGCRDTPYQGSIGENGGLNHKGGSSGGNGDFKSGADFIKVPFDKPPHEGSR